jgi:hypothetical protein
VTPNYFLWNAHNPEGHAIVSGKNKLPPPPNFLSGGRPDFIGIIVTITAEAIFVSIVMLARIKRVTRMVFFDIGFECPVLGGSQTPAGE